MTPVPRPFRIRTIMIGSFLLATVVPISFLAWDSYQRLSQQILSRTADQTRQNLRRFDSNLRIYLSEVENLTTRVFLDADVTRILRDKPTTDRDILQSTWKLEQVFNRLGGERTDLSRISLWSLADLVYEKTVFSPLRFQEGDGPVIEALARQPGRMVIYGTRRTQGGPGARGLCLTLGRKLQDLETGRPLGYLIVNLSLDKIQQLLVASDFRGRLCVVQEGRVLLDPPEYSLAGGPVPAGGLTGYPDQFPSSIPGWSYAVAEDRGALSVLLDQISGQILWVSLASFALFFSLTLVISHQISRPLKTLEEKMGQIEANRFEGTLVPGSYREIVQVSQRFNAMGAEIQRLLDNERDILRKRADLEVRALQLQISPHFLYNALESIHSLAVLRDVPEISQMVLSLAAMFKYSMKFDQEFVTLDDEVNHVRHYAQLQSVVAPGRFTLHTHVPPACRPIRVAKFLLQPLVENAVKHGFRDRRAGGELTISAELSGPLLVVEVRDNGQGILPDTLASLQGFLQKDPHDLYEGGLWREGLGLTNVHLRLKLLFGDLAGLDLADRPGGGTVVRLRVPLTEGADPAARTTAADELP